MTAELTHYGVKGMKWGVRKEYKPHPRKSGDYSTASTVSAKTQRARSRRMRGAKFVTKAMLGAAVGVAAQQTTAAIGGNFVAGVLGGVAVATVAKKYGSRASKVYLDTKIKKGTKFQRITSTPDEKLDRIYATYKKGDNMLYRGRLGFLRAKANGETYVKKFEAKIDIKAPSDKKAMSVFDDIYKKDKEFAYYVDHIPKTVRNYVSGAKDVKGRYQNFNLQGLMDRDPNNQKQVEKFYKALKKEGYNAVTDLNDRKFSTFKANNPVVLFDMSGVVESSVKKLSNKEIGRDLALDQLTRNGQRAVLAYLGLLGVLD